MVMNLTKNFSVYCVKTGDLLIFMIIEKLSNILSNKFILFKTAGPAAQGAYLLNKF